MLGGSPRPWPGSLARPRRSPGSGHRATPSPRPAATSASPGARRTTACPETDPCLRLTAPRAVLEDRDGTTELAADGHVYSFAAQARPVLCTLLDGAPHSLSELSAASDCSSPEAIRILCGDLIRAGIVTVHSSRPRAEACR
jgi:hypothetical protein